MLLLIPGPVTTRPEVRQAMAQDIAPWDNDFRPIYVGIRERVLRIAHGIPGQHATLPLQGSGHFAVEAALRTFLPPGGRILIPATGAYSDRMVRLAREAGRVVVSLPVPDDTQASPAAIATALAADPGISHVGLVYSETGSGVIHDAPSIGAAVRHAGRRMILDAVSAFGALPLDLSAQPEIDAAIFTTNKCLEGLPGMSFAVARIDRAVACAGNAGSWSLDLSDIYDHALKSGWGSCRFTPAAQAITAFNLALDFYDAEGGQPARLARYAENAATLHKGVIALGLEPCLPRALQGPIVLNVQAPADPAWSLQGFVDALKRRGFLISNFYNTKAPSFRVGCIGAITPDDMRRFVEAVDLTLIEIGVRDRGASQKVA
ncbi:MAG TPA: 2-aminoethylphosphonate--pyruvate transaminase [Acetobacteraceae bacterium]|jgi:2-aminoethylphosphonate-pyruvate transaminase